MPSSLATLRARLQIKLDDAAGDFWTTAELDEHIQAALRDLSHHIPLEKKTTLATVASTRDVDISSLTPRIRIVAVEYKTGNYPRTYRDFSIWQDTLTIISGAEPDGSNADFYWHAPHTINGTSTLPEDHDETLLFLAAAMACDQQAADASNQVNVAGEKAPRNWSSLARSHRNRYEDRIAPRRGLHVRRLYTPHEPTATQDSDPGP